MYMNLENQVPIKRQEYVHECGDMYAYLEAKIRVREGGGKCV